LNWSVHATQYGIKARGLEFESWLAQLNKIIAARSNIPRLRPGGACT